MARQKEGAFATEFKHALEERYKGCIVCKLDSSYLQGIPDLIFLWGDQWAAFEIKNRPNAQFQANQHFWISKMYDMSFASVVNPENMYDVLEALDDYLVP